MTTPEENTPSTPLAAALRLLESGPAWSANRDEYREAMTALEPHRISNERSAEAALRIVAEDRARLEKEMAECRAHLADMMRLIFDEGDHQDVLAESTSWQAEQVRGYLYHRRDALAHAQREADALRSQLTAANQAIAGLEAANAELRRGLDMMTEEGARCAARCRYRNGIIRWLVEQLRGDSGAGESHWEQFPAYRAACVEINSDTTPNET